MSNAVLTIANPGPLILDRKHGACPVDLRVSFDGPIRTFAYPINVMSLWMESGNGDEAGYFGTPPMRVLKDEEQFDGSRPIEHQFDLAEELGRRDADELAAFPAGEARVQIQVVLWPIESRPVYLEVHADVFVV